MKENADYCFRRNLGEYIDDLDSNKNSDKMVISGTIHLLSNLDLRDEFNSLFVSSGIKVRKVNLCEDAYFYKNGISKAKKIQDILIEHTYGCIAFNFNVYCNICF